jgi:hypothetical protein
LTPAASAASGFSPTARISSPKLDRWRSHQASGTTTRKAIQVSPYWLKTAAVGPRPAKGFTSGIGSICASSPPVKIRRLANSEEPMRPMVSPMPDTCWLAPNVTVRSAMIAPDATPTTSAASSPASGDPVAKAVAKPANAPAYIVPSIPRLRTPLRSAYVSPMVP